jgi:hypothetical protein
MTRQNERAGPGAGVRVFFRAIGPTRSELGENCSPGRAVLRLTPKGGAMYRAIVEKLGR